MVEDGVFDLLDWQVRQVATLVLPLAASVVEILDALLVLPAADDEPALAAVTPDGAFEVVVVLTVANASETPCLKDCLDPVEDLVAHQGFVSSWILDALVRHDAQVVAVPEHEAEFVDGDGNPSRVPFGGLGS